MLAPVGLPNQSIAHVPADQGKFLGHFALHPAENILL